MLYQKELPVSVEYDVVVCGGGFSGFAAAYAAAREGARVLLIERGACLGGVGTQALVNHILGVRAKVGDRIKTCVGGVFTKIEETLVAEGSAVDYRGIDLSLNPHGWRPSLGLGLIFDNEKMKLLLERLLLEAGAKMLYMTDVVDVIREGSRIVGVVVHNKSGLQVIRGRYFVDATGDGDLCQMGGCEYLFGDEDGGLAAASLEMHVENVDHEALTQYMADTGDQRFRAIIGALKEKGIWTFPYEIFISVMLTQKDVFMINTIRQVGIDGTDAASLTRGITDGRRESFALLDIMRAHFPGFANATVRQIAPVIGIRETRRIRSDYILSVEDLLKGRVFEDCIALSGYGWDMPHPKSPSLQPFEGVVRKSPFTSIPYRCLIPVGLENVIMAGRCLGVEREVLGPVRVMGPCLAMGEAAGIASALAARDAIPYRDVSATKLRERIVEHGGIVDVGSI